MIKVSIIVPVYNEESTILEILEVVNRQKVKDIRLEVIVVDDGSKDKSVELLRGRSELYSELIVLPKNLGKGGAVKAGLGAATGEYILFQDADLEYDPDDYAVLFRPILEFEADIVIGSRLMAPPYTRVHYYWHRLGNRAITFLFNIVNNTTFSDIYSCYLLYRRELVRPERLFSMGWEQQAEILSKAVRAGSVYYEVPISYRGRTYSDGKKIRWYHILSVFFMIVRQKVFPRA